MSITVQIPTPFRRLTFGTKQVDCAVSNLPDLFATLGQKFPDLTTHLQDEAGEVRRFLNVYVNDEDMRYLEKEATALKEGDTISIVPSIAGGRGNC